MPTNYKKTVCKKTGKISIVNTAADKPTKGTKGTKGTEDAPAK